MLPNCPIRKANIIRAEEILGPNLGSLKGKNNKNQTFKGIYRKIQSIAHRYTGKAW